MRLYLGRIVNQAGFDEVRAVILNRGFSMGFPGMGMSDQINEARDFVNQLRGGVNLRNAEVWLETYVSTNPLTHVQMQAGDGVAVLQEMLACDEMMVEGSLLTTASLGILGNDLAEAMVTDADVLVDAILAVLV